MRRVFPTGKCWCGCGETTEPTSFFVPGHDKKAEAKVVKEIYGSVIGLLTAHGYSPEGRDPAATIPEGMDATGLQLLEHLSKESWHKEHKAHEEHVVLEFLNAENRVGPLCRAEDFHVEFLAVDRAVRFHTCSNVTVSGTTLAGLSRCALTVPFPDIGWVYAEHDDRNRRRLVARLRGAIVPDPIRFVPFG